MVENEIWKSTFQQIILLVDKYADKGSSTSFIEENSLEVRIGNPPEYLVKVFIYDHPSLEIVLRTRFYRPDGGTVVKVGEEGMPMMTIDYETPKEAEETLFSHLEIYLQSIG